MYIKPPFHGCFQLKNSAFFAMKRPWECHVSRAKVPFFLAWLGLALQPQLFAMPGIRLERRRALSATVSLLPAPAEAILRTTKETPELPQVLAVMRLVFCVAFFFAWNLPRILRCPQMSPDAQHVEVSLELKETESFRLWIQQGSDPTAFFRLVKSEHHID
jgi:hypothetical protein